MAIPGIKTAAAAFALIILLAAQATAQQELVSVSIQPDRTDWAWEDYSEQIASEFADRIERRVIEGFDAREFEQDSTATVLRFAFKISPDGTLHDFSPLTPLHRYHAYLIEWVEKQITGFRPLPSSFPLFYYKGIITFRCMFTPTRWYKKLYFEQPLDTLETPEMEPLIKTTTTTNLLLPTYEPQVQDKQKLLADYKKRIGAAEEITDTSGYSALDVSGRTFLVRVPYDSLGGDSLSGLLLQARLETALENAGARITHEDYDPDEMRRLNAEKAAADSAVAAARADSMAKAAAADSLLSGDSLAVSPDTAEPESTVAQFSTENLMSSVPRDRNLVSAFKSVFGEKFLVFSAGLARDSVGDSAVCRIKLYKASKPSELKRNLSYRFPYEGSLPDSLAIRIVQRLTKPPKKPAPPPPPAPDTTGGAAVRAASSAADSSSADTTAAAPSTQPDTTSAAVAPPQTSAAGDTTASATDSTAVQADTTAALADSMAEQSGTVDSTSTEAEPATRPSDSTAAQPDTTAATAPPGQ